MPDRKTEQREGMGRQTQFGSDLGRVVADAADIAAAEPERFQRDDGILRRKRRIDRAQKKAFEEAQAMGGCPLCLTDPVEPVQIDQPQQEQRRL